MKRLLAMLLVLCLPLTALAENLVWVGSQPVTDYEREMPIDMPAGDAYQVQPWGVTTWRGSSFRQNAAVGTLDGPALGLELVWTAETGALYVPQEQFWGFSWYSQPAIVKWPREVRQAMITLTDEARHTEGMREVIFPSLDGKVYFLRLVDGTVTRDPIDVGYPLMGAPTLHPLGYPLMMTGQYSDQLRNGWGSIGLHWHELLTQRSIRFVDGRMEALGVTGAEGAFNTSALIDHNTNTAVSLSRDGYLYTVQLDTRLAADGTGNEIRWFDVDFAPAVIAKVTEDAESVTTAPAMHGSLLYFGSDEGRLRCIDTTTMQTRWMLQLNGPLYATPALEWTSDGLVLYAGTQDAILCLDAGSGEVLWQHALPTSYAALHGAVASPVVGRNALEGLVFFVVSGYTDGDGSFSASVLALDSRTGESVWEQKMENCVASPVAVYGANGSGWLIQAESSGMLHLLDGLTGAEVDALVLDALHLSSPAAYGDMLVIGGKTDHSGRIFGVRIVTAEEPVQVALPADQQAIVDFLTAWRANDRQAMLALCAPSWRAQQTDADRMLFLLLRNRTAQSWRLGEIVTAGEACTCPVEVLLDMNNGRAPEWSRMTLNLLQEDGTWYVEPSCLAAVTPVDAP